MPFLSRLSIKVQLFIIVLIVALPAVGIIINSGIQQRRYSAEDALRETQKIADTLATEQNHIIDSTRQLCIALSQIPEVKDQDKSKIQDILSQIVKLSPQYANIFIADLSGNVWVSAVPIDKAISVSDRRYFKNSLLRRKMSSGEYIISRTAKKATFNLGYPIKDNKGVSSNIICVAISLENYRKIFKMFDLPKGASFSMLDYAGVVLARAVDPEKYIGTQTSKEILEQMKNGPDEQTSEGTSSIQGDRRIQTYRKLRLEGEEEPYMYIRVGIPINSLMSQANTALYNNIIVYSAFLIIACLLSWFISKRYITDRVQALKVSSKLLADGDLSVRVSSKVRGGELGSLGQSFDIMAQKLSEREKDLAASERFLSAVIDTEPECVKIVKADLTLSMMNRAGLEMIQADSFEQVKDQNILSLIAPEHQEIFKRTVDTAMQGRAIMLRFEIIGLKGRHLWMEIHVVPFRNENDEIISVLGITRDITEQMQAESQNKNLFEQLLQSQKVESIGRLAGGIAHDLNNLLTPIIGYAELLKKEFDENSIGNQRVKNILLASDKAKNLIQQLLSFSRRQVLNVTPTDMSQLVLSFSDILRRTIRENIEIELNLTKQKVHVSVDKNQIEQVIMNLMVNAQDAITTNGHICVETAAVKLDESYTKLHAGVTPGNFLMLSISDNGVGMDKETQQHIFEPFYTTKGVGHGTGLGLSTVHGIVTQHGGSVWMYSEQGIGTTFKIYLPIIDEYSEKAAEDTELDCTVIHSNIRILLVEDENMVRNMTKELLESYGFEVLAAESPKQALKLMEFNKVNLILSDVIMPEMSGPDLFEVLKQTHPNLRVVYMSGYSANLVAKNSVMEDGAIFIQKPFTSIELIQKINSILS